MNRAASPKEMHRVFANIGWLGASQALQLLVAFFVGAWVIRYLGPEDYGTLALSLAWVALFSPLMQISGSMVLVRNFVAEPETAGTAFATALVLRLAGALFLVFAAPLAAELYASDKGQFVFFIGILAVAQCAKTTDIIDLWFQSQVKSKFSVIASSIAVISSAATRISLIYFNANLEAFVWAIAAEWVLQATALLIIFKRFDSLRRNVLRPSFAYAKTLIADSWPMILSGLASTIYMRIDQVMLANMLGETAVGTYSAAARITEAAFFIPNIICISLFPALVKAQQEDQAYYNNRLQQLFSTLLLIAMVIVSILYFGSGSIINLFYGEEYIEAVEILKIHSIALIFIFFAVPSGRHLIAQNHILVAMIRPVVGALVNVTLNFQLIPRYGVNGAAIATVVSYFCSSLVAILPFSSSRPLVWMFVRSMNPRIGWVAIHALSKKRT